MERDFNISGIMVKSRQNVTVIEVEGTDIYTETYLHIYIIVHS